MEKTSALGLISKPEHRWRNRTVLWLLTSLAAIQGLSAATVNTQASLSIVIGAAPNVVPTISLTNSLTINNGTIIGSPTENISLNSGFAGDLSIAMSVFLSTNAPGDSVTNADYDFISDSIKLANNGVTTQSVTISPGSSSSAQTAVPTSVALSLFMAIEQFNAATVQWESLRSQSFNLGTAGTVSCSPCLTPVTVNLDANTFADLRLHERITGSVALAAPEPGTAGFLATVFALGAVLVRRRRHR